MAGMTADEPFISLQNVRKVYRSKGTEFLAVSEPEVFHFPCE